MSELIKQISELGDRFWWIFEYWWVIPALISAVVWVGKTSRSYGDLDLVSELKQGSGNHSRKEEP